MATTEERFPDAISYGSSFGGGFDTRVAELDSGSTEAVRRRTQPKRRYNAVHTNTSRADLATIQSFYWAIGGISTVFRWKDFADFTSRSDGLSTPTAIDIQIGVGDGTTTDFQLFKRYTLGAFSNTRTINKPVAGTVRVSVDLVELPDGTHTFSVNTATGVVTITPAPPALSTIHAGFEFDTPVRFDETVDQVLQHDIEYFDGGNIPDIPINEELNPTPVSEIFPNGGSFNHGAITGDITISESNGRVQIVEPSTGPHNVRMPDPTPFPTGNNWFYVVNKGTVSVNVTPIGGPPAIISLGADGVAEMLLGLNSSGTKIWIGK